jgi:hypothetical protein
MYIEMVVTIELPESLPPNYRFTLDHQRMIRAEVFRRVTADGNPMVVQLGDLLEATVLIHAPED